VEVGGVWWQVREGFRGGRRGEGNGGGREETEERGGGRV